MQMDFSHGDLTILQINVGIFTDAYVTNTEEKNLKAIQMSDAAVWHQQVISSSTQT